MQWIAPSEKDAASTSLEKRLWDAADQFRANSGLKAQEYSGPILGLIFLRFAEVRFALQRNRLKGASATTSRRGSRVDEPAAYHAEGILYLAPEARFDYLLTLPEVADIGARVNAAMREIEKHNPQLAGVLPKTYNLFTSTLLKELLKKVSEIPATLDYDAFGRIYEYFLGAFAMTEGQGGGEFYTPSSIVKLLAEIIEPFHGRILDPACGSGGMFVQSARFVAEHQKNPAAELAICGVEKTDETGRLCRLNLAVHGLEGDIKHGGNINSYYDDPHSATGQFDFVLANPPFNVNAVDKERLAYMVGAGRRFPFGLPRTDNANYLWIQLFYSALNAKGRAGFVMANSASDARSSRAGTAAEADRSAGGRCHGRRRPQHVLHRHAALHAVVPRQGQGPIQTRETRRHRALHRRPPHLPAGRSRPPRLDAGADRLHRQPGPPLSRRGARHHRRR
jgi:type I restriction enzyme M protein